MTQQLHVAGLPRVTEDGYFDAANANKSWVRVHGGQSSEFPIYPTTRERTISHHVDIKTSLALPYMANSATVYSWIRRMVVTSVGKEVT